MPRIKKKRVAIRIDMTPLVDVAFLLLTFFMLTTTFKPPEDVQVVYPMSHSEIKLPESNTMLVFIEKDGTIWMGFDTQTMMEKMFGAEYKYKQASTIKKEQLGETLMKARIANPKLRTIVKADASAEYGVVEDVMNIFEQVKITRFNMVTNFEVTTKS
jgi:biopolymer transport protein ExbD